MAGMRKTINGRPRFKCILIENIVETFPKHTVRKLARRAGVKRVSSELAYEDARNAARTYLTEVMRDSIIYMELAKRKTVMALDVVWALKR